jgi:hypothetical protein
MKPADVHALLLPLQPGDLTPAELDIHGQRQWTVVRRDDHPAILALWLEDRNAPQHMFFGYPKCWVASNTSKAVLSNIYAEYGSDERLPDLFATAQPDAASCWP